MKTYAEILKNLEQDLESIDLDFNNYLLEVEKGVYACKKTLESLRHQVLENGFENKEAECVFFKTVKPTVVGYLVYYLEFADIQKKRPLNGKKEIKKYYCSQISHLQSYFLKYQEFYEYLIRNRTDRDEEYFSRTHGKISFHLDALLFCTDADFSTSHDMLAAKFIAYELLIAKFSSELNALKDETSLPKKMENSKIAWTGSKVDLIELIYALHSTIALDQGRADIKKIAQTFEKIFQIELGDYYRTFLEIRGRKLQRTKFLDYLKSNLERRMEEADG